MYPRFYLIIDGKKYDVTRDQLRNWDEVVLTLTRNNYDGVTRSFSTNFEFCNNARLLLRKHWEKNYLNSSASIQVQTQTNNWKYKTRFTCQLDFLNYLEEGDYIVIPGREDSLTTIINSKKSQTYDIPVNDLSPDVLQYDRLTIQNTVNYLPLQMDDEKEDQGEYIYQFHLSDDDRATVQRYTFPLIILGEDVLSTNNGQVDYQEIYNLDKITLNGYFPDAWNFQSTHTLDVHVKCKFTARLRNENSNNTGYIRLYYINKEGRLGNEIYNIPILTGEVRNIVLDETVTLTPENPNLVFILGALAMGGGIFNFNLVITDVEEFYISYLTRDKTIPINIVRPVNLLRRLVENMTGETRYTCKITDSVDLLNSTYLCAGESVRDLEYAKFHTTFSKFADWMRMVFGVIYHIEDDAIVFKKREEFFSREIVKEITEVNGFSLSVNAGVIYSGVEVGYEKQDYDSANGRDEFRFTNSWETGVKLQDNRFSLVSPYRADAYGFEFLSHKRGEKTTDSTSDNTIFFVAVEEKKGQWGPLRTGWTITGVLDPESMFNVMFSPRHILLNHLSYLGACTSNLTFTAAEGNSEVIINGVSETEPIVITKDQKLYSAEIINFVSPEYEEHEEWNGLIAVTYKGRRYEGFIDEVNYNYGRPTAADYKLYLHSREEE